MIISKNEEANIGRAVRRAQAFDEVIVIDSCSADRTKSIAESNGARVVEFEWNGMYPKKKQWALENSGARNEWVMLLDSDEYASEELLIEISNDLDKILFSRFRAYDLGLQYRFAGRFLRYGHAVTKRSLLNTRYCAFPEVGDLDAPGVTEVEGHYQPRVDGSVGRLNGKLVHDDVDPVASWFSRHNRYSDWEAYLAAHPKIRSAVRESRSRQGQIFDRVPFKPAVFFLYSYLFRRGFLDGRAGLDYSIALSTYYWQIGLKMRENQKDSQLDCCSR
ncbi:glycosyltransferase family 2 protein [Rhodococcus ruber]|uniref:glycosyltransferase family 2 protein n=1 Tax=Rhodococcus ruber TaxID=1830 RepID=UPI00192A268F|nr:glycosyltransferase family 2 protein [Rhodococcus ruber]